MVDPQSFIDAIAPYVVAWAEAYRWGVPSAIIAQACHETGYGQAPNAQKKVEHNNYFGLKFKKNRVKCNNGVVKDTSWEQRPDGSLYKITTEWYSFDDMNKGVQGYFQFIDTGGYSAAKAATTPEAYLNAIKAAGYATGINYAENCMKVVNTYNLTKYDGGVLMADSALVKGTIWSPNYTAQRKYAIDTIIIHCMAGTYDAVRCGQLFADPKRQASSHYGISSNGDIYQYVSEKYRAWTTGGDKTCNGWTGSNYDHRSITMEVSNTTLAPDYQISAAACQSIIDLCADICKRHNIKELKWSNNPKLVGRADLQNMAVHRWFATKSCPGNFIMQLLPGIALAVNQRLAAGGGYILNGLDYSPVFNPTFYASKYPDLNAAFGTNADALWLHFQNYGMNEFRQASAEFNPVVYKQKYADLRAAYGNNNPMYYYHYVAFGKAEGRTAV